MKKSQTGVRFGCAAQSIDVLHAGLLCNGDAMEPPAPESLICTHLCQWTGVILGPQRSLEKGQRQEGMAERESKKREQ